MSKFFYFSALRKGLAAMVSPAEGTATRLQTEVSFTINEDNEQIKKQLGLYGPGDVLGIQLDKVVLRREPFPAVGDFEPNYIPFIEFSEADFLWRYSGLKVAKTAGEEVSEWIPWLSLAVLKMKDGEEAGEYEEVRFSSGQGHPIPQINLTQAGVLPDLSQSWRWAHAQAKAASGADSQSVQTKVRSGEIPALCRLLSPRRLEAGVKYCAFLLPAYRQGKDSTAPLRSLMWEGNGGLEQGIPYYDKWEFRTGQRGGFEYLARLLEPQKIEGLGKKKIDCSYSTYPSLDKMVQRDPDGLTEDDPDYYSMDLEGALRSTDEASEDAQAWGMDIEGRNSWKKDDFRTGLALLLNQAIDVDLIEEEEEGEDPIVMPPTYGRPYLPKREISSEYKTWQDELNLDPRHRAVAGLGAELIREHQEQFMAGAWEQLEAFQEVNKLLNRAQFARAIAKPMQNRLEQFGVGALVGVLLPMSGKVTQLPSLTNPTSTLKHELRQSLVPNASLKVSNRKLLRGRGPVHKRINKPAAAEETSILGTLFTDSAQQALAKSLKPNLRIAGMTSIPLAGLVPAAPQEAAPRFWKEAAPPQASPRSVPLVTLEQELKERLTSPQAVEQRFKNKTTAFTEADNTSDPLQLLQFEPIFPVPLSHLLKKKSQDFLLPGIEKIPQNTAIILSTNPRFLEALLVGANQEFLQEALWRELPIHTKGTFFRTFWDYGDEEKEDIEPIPSWNRYKRLGRNANKHQNIGRLTLLLRSQLLNKHPNCRIYLAKQDAASNSLLIEEGISEPIFAGNLPPDIVFLGFKDTLRQAQDKYDYLVLEQRTSEQRFGLDIERKEGQAIENNLTWDDFELDTAGYLKASNLDEIAVPWDSSSQIASTLTQQPVRLALALSLLLPS